jgi:hypothetical protein
MGNDQRNLAVIESDDEKSETSTIHDEDEPFDTFQHEVAKLLEDVIHPVLSDIKIERMKGGTYNRVVGVNIRVSRPSRSASAGHEGFYASF